MITGVVCSAYDDDAASNAGAIHVFKRSLQENPDFTANSTLHTNYSTRYGWSSNSGWVVDADTQHDNSEANYGAWSSIQ